MPWSQLVLTVVLVIGLLWSGVRLRRGDRSVVIRSLVAVFGLSASGNIISTPAAQHILDSALVTGTGKVVFNALVIGGLCALVLLLREGADAGSAFIEVGVGVSVVVAMVTCELMEPSQWRATNLANLDHGISASAVAFYLVGNAYFVYAYGVSAVRTSAMSIQTRWTHRVGIIALSVGLGCLCLTSIVRMGWVLAPGYWREREPSINRWNFALANVGNIILCVGLCLPVIIGGVSVVRVRADRIRQLRRLRPLWLRLMAAYPDLMLGAPRGLYGFYLAGGIEWGAYRDLPGVFRTVPRLLLGLTGIGVFVWNVVGFRRSLRPR